MPLSIENLGPEMSHLPSKPEVVFNSGSQKGDIVVRKGAEPSEENGEKGSCGDSEMWVFSEQLMNPSSYLCIYIHIYIYIRMCIHIDI